MISAHFDSPLPASASPASVPAPALSASSALPAPHAPIPHAIAPLAASAPAFAPVSAPAPAALTVSSAAASTAPAVPAAPARFAPISAPRAFYLHNQVSQELHPAALAELPTLSQRPAFAEKQHMAQWAQDARTRHVFYSLAEPERPGLRSSRHNPIKYLHGIVADYDGAAESIQAALPTLKFGPGLAPTWVTTTFSGKARLIWAFAERVPVFSPEVYGGLVRRLVATLKLRQLLPGLDEAPLLHNPHTPFELGTDWRQPYGDTRLSPLVVANALHEASARAKWPTTGPDIPLETVAEEVERRWPDRWAGPFTEGARGLRFWDPAADNPTGCTIRAGGVQAWSGEARFIPWAELLGADFVRRSEESRIGEAIDGTYYDGRSYWVRNDEGAWEDTPLDVLKRRLMASQGLSPAPRKGQPSELVEALATIERYRRVDGAFPCLFVREPVLREDGWSFLNISRARPVRDIGVCREWGDGFAWIAAYLDGMFDSEQRTVLLSWLAHFYKHAVAGKPRSGQALFIAGPPGAGKSLFSRRIVGGLMGGSEEATDLVLGRSPFNESLFFKPVWAIDDGVPTARPGSHAEYSEVVKKIVANPYQPFHPKHKKAVSLRFHGRLIVTLNDNEEATAMLPRLDYALADKVIFLLARDPGVALDDAEARIASELPAFSEYLARYEIPEHLRTRRSEFVRFGLDSWQHPTLRQQVEEASDRQSAAEYLTLWRTEYFRFQDEMGQPRAEWSGTATALLGQLLSRPGLAHQLRHLTRTRLCRDLQRLHREGTPWLGFARSNTQRTYTIARPGPEEGFRPIVEPTPGEFSAAEHQARRDLEKAQRQLDMIHATQKRAAELRAAAVAMRQQR